MRGVGNRVDICFGTARMVFIVRTTFLHSTKLQAELVAANSIPHQRFALQQSSTSLRDSSIDNIELHFSG
ncbi:hypothetical protein P8452_55894 [Trifolium repens]|nr:hypothetical protein P8452_55894 [Trifolium repens]